MARTTAQADRATPVSLIRFLDQTLHISYAFVMKTYSFKRLTLDILDIEKPDFEGKLDAYGSQGWQLVSSFDREKGGNSKEVYFIFMRATGE